MKKMKCLMLLTVIVGLVTVPALARDALFSNEGVLHEKVQYSDLNLANARGVEVLYQRIKSASEHVCGDYHDVGISLALWSMTLQCKHTAVEAAVVKIGNAALTQLYETRLARRGGKKPMLASNMPKIEVSLE